MVTMAMENEQKYSRRMVEYRCNYCSRYLFSAHLERDTILRLRCPKCGKVNLYDLGHVKKLAVR